MTIPVQFAFQGGGAKVAALLAAAEAIQDACGQNLISVSRVSGTSAGSIVACLLAGKINIGEVRQRLRGEEGKSLVRKFKKPGRLGIAWKLFRENPIWKVTPLTQWLDGVFREAQLVHIRDLKKKSGIDALVVSTDMTNRKPVISDPDEFIAAAITDSCALPFLFRVWPKDGGYFRVDGGICENLPSGKLSDPAGPGGDVIAVSFPPTLPESPNGFKSFALSLLDTAISSAMASARNSLKADSVLELRTSLSTFSFERALDVGLGDEYDRIKLETTRWIERFVEEKQNNTLRLLIWNDQNQVSKLLLKQMADLYGSVFSKSPIRYANCRFTIAAHSLARQKKSKARIPDSATVELEFYTEDQPVYAIAMSIIPEAPGAPAYDGDNPECFVTNGKDEKVNFHHIPIADDDDPLSRRLAIFFDPPLPPNSGSYHFMFREFADVIMTSLLDANEEDIRYHAPPRASGPVPLVELVLHAPNSAKLAMLSCEDKGVTQKGRTMTQGELSKYNPPQRDMQSLGWVVNDLPNMEAAAVKVLRTSV